MSRYKVILVEDEKWIRLGLKSTIHWEELGLGPVLEAADGESALKLILTEAPEIIISDIKMPNMSGLQLVERLRSMGSQAKVILITAFGEFSYAQSAIQNGVSDYILKPIQEEKVTQALKKCIGELDAEKELADRRREVSDYAPIVQEHYFSELMHAATEQEAAKSLDALNRTGLDFTGKRAVLVTFRYVPDTGSTEKMLALLNSTLAGGCKCFFLKNHTYEICAIVLLDVGIPDAFSVLCERVTSLPGGDTVRFGVGIGEPGTMEQLNRSYGTAKADFGRRFFALDGENASGELLQTEQEEFPAVSGNRVCNLLAAGNREALENMIREKLGEVQEYAARSDAERTRLQLTAAMDNLISQCVASGIVNLRPRMAERCGMLKYEPTLRDFARALRDLLECYFGQTDGDGDSVGFLINHVLQYVHAHYSEELSMNQVAKQFYVNPSYFSHLFSEQLNTTFTKYLNSYRIQKSKELLEDTRLRVYDVASMVGIEDYRYFVKVFKKSEGVTPSEYRNRILTRSLPGKKPE